MYSRQATHLSQADGKCRAARLTPKAREKEPNMTTVTSRQIDLPAIAALLDRMDPQVAPCCVGECIHHHAHHAPFAAWMGDWPV